MEFTPDDFNFPDNITNIAFIRLNKRSKTLYKYALVIYDEYDSYGDYPGFENYCFNLVKSDDAIYLTNLEIDRDNLVIIKMKDNKFEVTCSIKYDYQINKYLIKQDIDSEIEIVKVKVFKDFFDYGKDYTYLANKNKCKLGDIVAVYGQFEDKNMVVTQENTIIKANELEFDISKIQLVKKVLVSKKKSDSRMIEYLKNNQINNEIKYIKKFSDYSLTFEQRCVCLSRCMKDGLVNVVGIKRNEGNKIYIFASDDFDLKKAKEIKKSKFYFIGISEIDDDQSYEGRVELESRLVNINGVLFPLENLAYLFKK